MLNTKVINGKAYTVLAMRGVEGTDKYEVHGGDSIYYLYPRTDGSVRCTCPGYRYHGECRHQVLAPTILKHYPLATMQVMATGILQILTPLRVEVCGSVRRQRFTCKDLDFVLRGDKDIWEQVVPTLANHYNSNWVPGKAGQELISGHICSVPVDFTRVSMEREWPFMTLYRTGSRETNIKMRGRAKGWGWKLNERGLFDEDGGLLECEDEREIFGKLDLKYLEPMER